MEYTFALIIHLFCSIIFLGFVFSDVVIFPILKKKLGEVEYQKIMEIIISRGIKIFPPAVLLLILSGGFMFSKYINSQDGLFNSNLQVLLMIKVSLVLIIALAIIYSLFCRFTNTKQLTFIKKHGHTLVLILGILIVILAKLMFVV